MPKQNSYVGKWEVLEATLPNGKPGYTGTIAIRAVGSTFDLEWDISDGAYVGVGLLLGERLVVSCGPQLAGLGLVIFEVVGDAVTAEWTVPELRGAIGGGLWVSPWTGDFAGSHRLVQRLPDGTLHGDFALELRRDGEVFAAEWRVGDVIHFRGVGFEVDGALAVGFYPDPGQLALLDYALVAGDREEVEGRWALGGFATLATERLRRMG